MLWGTVAVPCDPVPARERDENPQTHRQQYLQLLEQLVQNLQFPTSVDLCVCRQHACAAICSAYKILNSCAVGLSARKKVRVIATFAQLHHQTHETLPLAPCSRRLGHVDVQVVNSHYNQRDVTTRAVNRILKQTRIFHRKTFCLLGIDNMCLGLSRHLLEQRCLLVREFLVPMNWRKRKMVVTSELVVRSSGRQGEP